MCPASSPRLTWRDMQHIVVMSARPDGLTSNDWVVNGVGRKGQSHALTSDYSIELNKFNIEALYRKREALKLKKAGQKFFFLVILSKGLILFPRLCVVYVRWHTSPYSTVVYFLRRQSLLWTEIKLFYVNHKSLS